MLLGHEIIVKTDHKNLTHPALTHTVDRVLRQCLLLEEYGAELQCIQGEKNVVANALSCLPTQELFTLQANDDEFPLNLALIADKQTIDKHLLSTLSKEPPKYKKVMRENTQLYVHHDTEAIYVSAALLASILQWYHTTLQHPGIKRMQATLKENF
jgi:hypothetical protein